MAFGHAPEIRPGPFVSRDPKGLSCVAVAAVAAIAADAMLVLASKFSGPDWFFASSPLATKLHGDCFASFRPQPKKKNTFT